MVKIFSTGTPVLESWIARAGIVGVTALSGYIGWSFWSARGNDVLAWLTVCCEATALGGMAMVLFHGRERWGRAAGGVIVTALASAWCAMTMSEKLTVEAQARAARAAQESAAYVQAEQDLEFGSSLYRSALAATIPEGLGPLGTEARRVEIAQRVAVTKAERDAAQARLDKLAPEPSLDWLAIARSAGIEIAKVVGLVVFGFGFGRQSAPAVPQLTPGQVLANARWSKRRAA